MNRNAQIVVHALTDVVANGATNSASIKVDGAKKISVVLKAESITSGNGSFSVEVSADGVNWVTLNKLITNVANSNVQQLIRVAALALSSNSNELITLDPSDTYSYMRVKVTRTTDGKYNAWVVIQR